MNLEEPAIHTDAWFMCTTHKLTGWHICIACWTFSWKLISWKLTYRLEIRTQAYWIRPALRKIPFRSIKENILELTLSGRQDLEEKISLGDHNTATILVWERKFIYHVVTQFYKENLRTSVGTG